MPNTPSWRIGNLNIVAGGSSFEGEALVENGTITAITPKEKGSSDKDVPVIDGEGGWLLPGFIDVHVHGGYGSDFMDANAEAYDAITKFHASHGTTGMLATTMTNPPEALEAVLQAATAYQEGGMPYAALLGVHLEGPFISEKWAGAQNPAYIQPPHTEWLKRWIVDYPGIIKMMMLAPEKEGALETIEWLTDNGIIAACGHTDALYEDIKRASEVGLRHTIHTFNAMRGLHHREPGTLGAVATIDSISTEIIADGQHVHPAAIELLRRAKPADKLILITDAISAAGLDDGPYSLGGLDVKVEDGIARLREGGNLAGSTLTMINAFRFMLEHTNLTVPQVSQLASGNPARLLGVEERMGSIALGKQADLVWTDANFAIRRTWVQGRTVYEQA
ncbi:N-acetylglucosamine-6-phosphate deacetylase [Paenibacillus phyllosphaerae]|uniref:N-acetylglucosamine-6-phosphate deacetylase n=1 Tax=Paenibacillus phyllosphaerae TaxID=274593 RepID=A0A7W5FKL2_9BACL|nr:N-acetylglucosamine-6-phosphate deacetylase [Paenibacillus phyllosphaerae]MBB3108251.1 N-acetylglucosamine-6-phosphate deacetylase [Paenibacillus phyllosphaerae]